MKFEIPSSLQEEHKALHEALETFTKMSGKTGTAATEEMNIKQGSVRRFCMLLKRDFP